MKFIIHFFCCFSTRFRAIDHGKTHNWNSTVYERHRLASINRAWTWFSPTTMNLLIKVQNPFKSFYIIIYPQKCDDQRDFKLKRWLISASVPSKYLLIGYLKINNAAQKEDHIKTPFSTQNTWVRDDDKNQTEGWLMLSFPSPTACHLIYLLMLSSLN